MDLCITGLVVEECESLRVISRGETLSHLDCEECSHISDPIN